jgi:hypothetical protein
MDTHLVFFRLFAGENGSRLFLLLLLGATERDQRWQSTREEEGVEE